MLLVLVCPGSWATSCFYPGNCHAGHPLGTHWAPTGFEAGREHCGSSTGLPPRLSAAAGPEACCANSRHRYYPWKLENPHRLTQRVEGRGAQGEEESESVCGVGRETGPRPAATSRASSRNERTLHQQFSRHRLVVEGKETRCPRQIPWKLAWRSTRGLC